MNTTLDVRWACDVLRPVFDASDGVDGRVSIEVDPRLAHETDRTVAEARQLWWLVDRPNLFVKIPATKAGLPAIAQCIAEGISVNVTLIFSLERYGAVMDAYLDGMERARVAGHDLTNLASVASFFVSRVDTEVDQRLGKLGTAAAKTLLGKAAIANARLAYQRYEQVFSTDRWASLAGAGARPQRPLWASTGVKDPSYDDTMYVVELVTRGVVNTMPDPTTGAASGDLDGDAHRIACSLRRLAGARRSLTCPSLPNACAAPRDRRRSACPTGAAGPSRRRGRRPGARWSPAGLRRGGSGGRCRAAVWCAP